MKFLLNKKILIVVAVLLAGFAIYLFVSKPARVDFSADVKPIINSKCISCHGGVKAKSGFSLLFREEALAKAESGKYAIVPGDPAGSELIRRITHNDPEERMPYRHEALSKSEISILKRWIAQGAQWGDHWAYLPVEKTAVPEVDAAWARTDIDRFIAARHAELELTASPEADRPTLLRRVSLDLTGVLPNEKIARTYLETGNYEVLVDSLLASPQYGERWAAMWLDLARYADTKGYESDQGRSIWHYRDWVIRAFNEDKPYDKFLTEQIAGDLLPNPTDADFVATAFHRNTMNNDEGGTDNEEFRTASIIDRVNTTWESLMGTTFSCVQCHSHPYDPFRHEEYYKFMAFFNNTRDEDVPGEFPLLRHFEDSIKQQFESVARWLKENAEPAQVNSALTLLKTWQPAINSNAADSLSNAVIINNNNVLLIRNNATIKLKKVDMEGVDQMVGPLYTNKKGGVFRIRLDSPTGPLVSTYNIPSRDTRQYVKLEFERQSGIHDVYITYSNPNLKDNADAIYIDWFSFSQQMPGKGKAGYEEKKKLFLKLLEANTPTTPIMMDRPDWQARTTHVFDRGNWREKGEKVEAAVPATLAFAMPANAPRNRVGLSMWLTSKKNPLVSRTIVNRLWEQLFGTGIVETLEDMGTQGLAPTHRELLDHLSWKLMNEQAWSLKKLLKEMVMSATYRQDSRVSDELKDKDLFNRYYARGPRLRLSAEQIRDQALCISGLVNTKMYGPAVKPFQPEGIWLSPYNGARWEMSKDSNQYRRGIYTYWKRTSPYPSMIAFDAPERVVCSARRIRTNTPLQALVTLNDSAYLDMARHFAWRMKKEGGANVEQQVAKGYATMMFRKIPEPKLRVFVNLYQAAVKEFEADKNSVAEMVGNAKDHDTPEDAALVVVANAMLNLDEVLMKN